jgi:cytidine deaminase
MTSAGEWERLVSAAIAARARAYAPYSRYRVGAAILGKSAAVYAGCNIENATYGATMCAERAAVAAMVAAGEQSPVACVIVTAGGSPRTPCGICRQVLAEFAPDLALLLVSVDRHGQVTGRKRARLGTLLPDAFRLIPPSVGSTPQRPGRGPTTRPAKRPRRH